MSKLDLAIAARNSLEFKAIVKSFRLKKYVEGENTKTPDYLVHNSQAADVRAALDAAGFEYSLSNVYGYCFRLHISGRKGNG